MEVKRSNKVEVSEERRLEGFRKHSSRREDVASRLCRPNSASLFTWLKDNFIIIPRDQGLPLRFASRLRSDKHLAPCHRRPAPPCHPRLPPPCSWLCMQGGINYCQLAKLRRYSSYPYKIWMTIKNLIPRVSGRSRVVITARRPVCIIHWTNTAGCTSSKLVHRVVNSFMDVCGTVATRSQATTQPRP